MLLIFFHGYIFKYKTIFLNFLIVIFYKKTLSKIL